MSGLRRRRRLAAAIVSCAVMAALLPVSGRAALAAADAVQYSGRPAGNDIAAPTSPRYDVGTAVSEADRQTVRGEVAATLCLGGILALCAVLRKWPPKRNPSSYLLAGRAFTLAVLIVHYSPASPKCVGTSTTMTPDREKRCIFRRKAA